MDEIKKLQAVTTEAAARVELATRARSMTMGEAFSLLCDIAGLDEEQGLAFFAADEFLFVDQLTAAVADSRARHSG